MSATRACPALGVLLVTCVLVGCRRETRAFDRVAPAIDPNAVRLSSLQPGLARQPDTSRSPYQDNAYGMAEGKRLFSAFNCDGCHAAGGGGIGPSLMDDEWIYGFAPDQIYSSIAQGRPDGMPSFGGRIPATQIWQLVAYIQSLGGATPKAASPGRNDDMALTPGEDRATPVTPVQTGHR